MRVGSSGLEQLGTDKGSWCKMESRGPGDHSQVIPHPAAKAGVELPLCLTSPTDPLSPFSVIMTSGSGDEVPTQPSLPPEAAQEGDLHLLWEALARKRRMSREPTLDSISELPEEDSRVQHLRQEAEETAPDLSEGYSTADELARTGEADLSHTSSDDESRAGTPSLVTYLKKAGGPGISPLASKVNLLVVMQRRAGGVSDLHFCALIPLLIHPFIHLHTIYPYVHNLTILTSIDPSPFILHRSLHLSICPSIHYLLTTFPFAYPSIHPSSHPSIHLFIHPSICPLFVIHPLICPPPVTPSPVELFGHLSINLSPPTCAIIYYPYLLLSSLPIYFYPVTHLSTVHSSSVYLFPLAHNTHYPAFTTHWLIIPAFAHLSICFSADLCTHPSTQLSLPPSTLLLPTQHHNHLPAYFFLHFPYTSPLTY